MREILFRGKRIDNGKWLEGYYGFDDNKPLIAINKANGINGYFVAAETVGQYTGLTDKNGKRIFEGDVVATPNYRGVVDYGTGCYCVRHGIDDPAIDIVMNDFDVYVVGNIHDNFEPLEEQS